MKFQLVNSFSGLTNKSDFDKVSDKLSLFFKKKTYGNDVQNVTIFVQCHHPDHTFLFPVYKIKYIKSKLLKGDLGAVLIENMVNYSILLNYNEVRYANNVDSIKYLCSELLIQIKEFEKIKKKIPNFDLENFYSDFNKIIKKISSE